jgi:hypothetical protein
VWYRFSKDNTGNIGLEEKIMRIDAERAIREKLMLKGDYWPETKAVQSLVNRVIKKIGQDFDDLNTMRNTLSTEELYPAVKGYVDSVLSKKKLT